jgi:prepilin-type processing-associated H-X9-DG protein
MNATVGAIRAVAVVLLAIVCGYLATEGTAKRDAAHRTLCMHNMTQLGRALANYESTHGHFPAVSTLDRDGTPLRGWLVELLPQLDYSGAYSQLKKDEPWDSPHNRKLLDRVTTRPFICPSDDWAEMEHRSNYLAVVGPGTIWRKTGKVNRKSLADPSVIVAAFECADSGKHWAEPYVLTAEEALERMKTGAGMRISTKHQRFINVLFADGHVEELSVDMPISLWRALLLGEIKCTRELDSGYRAPYDPLPVDLSADNTADKWTYKISLMFWTAALLMLFHRAWVSRPIAKQEPFVG